MFSEKDVDSGIHKKLKENCPNTDIAEEPPISQKRLVTFINHFIINTVDFVDKFSRHCTYKLFVFHEKINKIEAELCLLESKLKSIPEISEEKDVNVVLPKPEELYIFTEPQIEDTSKHETEPSKIPEPSDCTETEETKKESEDAVSKYRKMIQVGVPIEAVKLKMGLEGLDSSLLDS